MDIVYTSNSLIVTTPTDGNTSKMIAEDEYVFPCNGNQFQFAETMFISAGPLIFAAVSMLIVGLAMAFKELHTLFGYLLNIAIVFYCITAMGTSLMENVIAVNSNGICYVISIINLLGFSVEIFSTCLLRNFACIMYSCKKLYSEDNNVGPNITPSITSTISRLSSWPW